VCARSALPPCRAIPFAVRACCHPFCSVCPPVAQVHKDPSPLQIVQPPPSVGPQVRRRHLPCSASIAAVVETPSHRLSFLSRRSQSSTEPWSCFPALLTSIPDTGEAPRRCAAGELLRRHCHPYSLQASAPSLVTPVRRGPGAAVVKTSSWVGRRQAAESRTVVTVLHALWPARFKL
jgi:hypothetical protein